MYDRQFFVNAYASVPPPWEIGRAQSALVAVFDEIALTGSVLDLGCGTGENVLELARRGLDAWGLDTTPAAIATAEKRCTERGLRATFVVGDALEASALGRTFDTVLDCGLFHVIAEEDRRRYLEELPRVVPVGGRFLMLGFASNNTFQGPRGYSPDELRAYLGEAWREVFIRGTTFETLLPREIPAWVSLFVRER
ncbi:Methyltransferase [Minicystis rosea]|nr:Methyltransferase [Minicystis rosea]